MQSFVFLTAGIPAPVYFGVLIDTSCLKWGFKKCGSQGSCRLYDSHAFRYSVKSSPRLRCYCLTSYAHEMQNFLCGFHVSKINQQKTGNCFMDQFCYLIFDLKYVFSSVNTELHLNFIIILYLIFKLSYEVIGFMNLYNYDTFTHMYHYTLF